MLRAAFEAITNSRFGVFPFDAGKPTFRQGNARRYSYRMNAAGGLSLVPVRIEGGHARLMLGANSDLPVYDSSRHRWVVPDGLLHAAWVLRYRAVAGGAHPDAVRIEGHLPAHGQPGWCWLERIQHYRWDRQVREYVPDFSFWAVRRAAIAESELPTAPPSLFPPLHAHRSTGKTMRANGYFFASNQNIDRKHDERFFFSAISGHPSSDLDTGVAAEYHALLADYQSIHTDELAARHDRNPPAAPDTYLGPTPG